MTVDLERVAALFMLHAIQEWGQSETERIQAVQAALDAAGFDARATCGPVFGRIWPKGCEGKDAELATLWLLALTDTMQRGEFNAEKRHVLNAIKARRAEEGRSECTPNI